MDWTLLDYDTHKNLHKYVKDLNKFYLENKPLYELDNTYNGFNWIVVDDSVQNMIAFTRYDSEGNSIIAVLNFSRVNRICYEIGVEHPGVYQTVFNSADKNTAATDKRAKP